MWKFWSAGRIICFRQIFLLSLILITACGNNKPQQPDPQINQLKTDVRKLSDDNERLKQEIDALRSQLNQKAPPQETQSQTQAIEKMSLEAMKKEVAPVLLDTITRIKKANETPRSGDQFGMRMEYDLKHAVYGLVQTEDETAPYSAKVIVKFEKFLESGNSSKSYGSGSSTFIFSYRAGQWVLESYQ